MVSYALGDGGDWHIYVIGIGLLYIVQLCMVSDPYKTGFDL